MSTMPSVETVAREFIRVIRLWLTPDELAIVVEKNKEYVREGNSNYCATHEFLDSNLAMDEAMQNCGINMEWDLETCMPDALVDIFNNAWTMAKRADFIAENIK